MRQDRATGGKGRDDPVRILNIAMLHKQVGPVEPGLFVGGAELFFVFPVHPKRFLDLFPDNIKVDYFVVGRFQLLAVRFRLFKFQQFRQGLVKFSLLDQVFRQQFDQLRPLNRVQPHKLQCRFRGMDRLVGLFFKVGGSGQYEIPGRGFGRQPVQLHPLALGTRDVIELQTGFGQGLAGVDVLGINLQRRLEQLAGLKILSLPVVIKSLVDSWISGEVAKFPGQPELLGQSRGDDGVTPEQNSHQQKNRAHSHDPHTGFFGAGNSGNS